MVPSTSLISRILAPGDFVGVERAACGHDLLIPPSAPWLKGYRLPLASLRCRECDARGKAVVVSIRWGDPAA
jgi:hypothetical protein